MDQFFATLPEIRQVFVSFVPLFEGDSNARKDCRKPKRTPFHPLIKRTTYDEGAQVIQKSKVYIFIG